MANSLGQRRQDHLAFESRHHLTHTSVNAASEGDMAAGISRNVKSIRLRPLAPVAVGGTKEQQYLLAFSKLRIPEPCLASRRAEECLDRGFKPKHFVKCRTRTAGLF